MKIKNFVKDWIFPFVCAIILAILVNKFLFFQVSVPTKSMYPTIKPHDRIMVTKVYNKDKLKRGDIVVFFSDQVKEEDNSKGISWLINKIIGNSKEEGTTLIKRLIGLPGDTVKIDVDGKVYINGKEIKEPYVVYSGGIGGEFKVPKNKFFFMGDNRPNSFDSRYWDDHFVSFDDIKGKAQFIMFPFDRFGKFKNGYN